MCCGFSCYVTIVRHVIITRSSPARSFRVGRTRRRFIWSQTVKKLYKYMRLRVRKCRVRDGDDCGRCKTNTDIRILFFRNLFVFFFVSVSSRPVLFTLRLCSIIIRERPCTTLGRSFGNRVTRKPYRSRTIKFPERHRTNYYSTNKLYDTRRHNYDGYIPPWGLSF